MALTNDDLLELLEVLRRCVNAASRSLTSVLARFSVLWESELVTDLALWG